MDRSSFEAAVQIAKRYREQVGGTAPEMYATAFRNSPGPLTGWIQESEEDRNVWDGLGLTAQQLLRSGKPLPDNLALWVADVLAGMRKRPRQKKRKESSKRQPRPLARSGSKFCENWFMVAAIHELVANGYRPETRGGAGKCCPEGGSVCDAVGVAFSVGYKTVEGVRREYNAQVRRTKAWVESVLRKPENE